LDPFLAPLASGLAHSFSRVVREGDARNLVVEELGVPGALQWQDTDHHWKRELVPAIEIEELPPELHVENRLRHREVCPRLDLAADASYFVLQVGLGWIDCAGDREVRRSSNRGSGCVLAFLHLADDLDQPDGVDVVDGS